MASEISKTSIADDFLFEHDRPTSPDPSNYWADYWNDYGDDYWDDPSMAEKIIDEAVEQCREIIKKRIKKKVQDALEENKELNRENGELQSQISTLKYAYEKKLKEKEKSVKKELKEAVKKEIEKIFLGVKIGDTVYFAKENPYFVDCNYCKGNGEITFKEKTLTCPNCYCRGQVQEGKYYECITGVVERITINNQGKVSVDFLTEIECGRTKRLHTESGIVYFYADGEFADDGLDGKKEIKMFKTKEECMAKIKMLNDEEDSLRRSVAEEVN